MRSARRAPDIAVLVLTMLDDDESVFAAMRAGARGYLVKGAERRDIARALEAVGRGEVKFGPDVASRALTAFSAATPRTGPFPELTEREHEILDLVARGLTTGPSPHDSSSARRRFATTSRIFMKLQARDRGTAIVRAREAGLGEGQAS